jgi:hypothetical protein
MLKMVGSQIISFCNFSYVYYNFSSVNRKKSKGKNNINLAAGVAQTIEHLPHKHKTLSSKLQNHQK